MEPAFSSCNHHQLPAELYLQGKSLKWLVPCIYYEAPSRTIVAFLVVLRSYVLSTWQVDDKLIHCVVWCYLHLPYQYLGRPDMMQGLLPLVEGFSMEYEKWKIWASCKRNVVILWVRRYKYLASGRCRTLLFIHRDQSRTGPGSTLCSTTWSCLEFLRAQISLSERNIQCCFTFIRTSKLWTYNGGSSSVKWVSMGHGLIWQRPP